MKTTTHAARTLRLLLAGALAVTSLIACAENAEEARPGQTSLDEAQAGLTLISTCAELESYIAEVTVAELDKGIALYASGEPVMVNMGANAQDMAAPAGEKGASGGDGGDGSDGSSGVPSPSPESPKDPGANGPAHSDTNVQVQGVDEADLVKNDGNHIYVISGKHLRILKSLPAEETALIGAVELPGKSTDLFLNGDVALVYGTAWGTAPGPEEIEVGVSGSPGKVPQQTTPAVPPPEPVEPEPGSAEPERGEAENAEPDSGASKPGAAKPGVALETLTTDLRGTLTILTFIDLSDRTAPKVLRTVAMEASTVSARMIGTKVYTVTRGRLFLPQVQVNVSYGSGSAVSVDGGTNGSAGSADAEVDVDPPDDEPDSAPGAAKPGEADEAPGAEPSFEEQAAKLKSDYLAALSKGTLDDWLPKLVDVGAGGTSKATLPSCGSFYKPTIQLGLDLLSIIELDLADPGAPFEVTTTLGNVGTVYASQTAIYAASYTYDYWFWSSDEAGNAGEFSMLHKFDLSEGKVQYSASAKIPGHILNQFSIDEHKAHVRVATTSQDWTSEVGPSSAVYVLDAGLTQVGSVGNLGVGEQIYSARFMGDRGYVVTFKKTDPLYSLDLSSPTDPKVGGELKIPGFSTYIHPLGEDHLLTIGRDTFDNGSWVSIDGVAVQIFDVSDISNPTQAHKEVFGSGGTSSEALYDHKAFNFFANKGLLCIPFEQWGTDSPGGGVMPETDGGTDEGGAGEGSDAEPPPEEPPDTDEPEDPEEPYDGWKAGVKVFTIDAAKGIGELGTISHSDLVSSAVEQWDRARPRVRRTLLIEENLYTMGRTGVKVHASADLTEIASLLYPEEDLCDWCGGEGDSDKKSGPTPTPAPAPDFPDEPDGEPAE